MTQKENLVEFWLVLNIERFDVGSFKQGEFMLQMNLWDKEVRVKWNLLIVYGAEEENKISFLSRFYLDFVHLIMNLSLLVVISI